jgi:hypothetical protein
MTAEGYYLFNFRSNHNCMEKSNRQIQQFDFNDMTDFAEQYGKQQWNEAIDKAAEAADVKHEYTDALHDEVFFTVNKESILKLKKP